MMIHTTCAGQRQLPHRARRARGTALAQPRVLRCAVLALAIALAGPPAGAADAGALQKKLYLVGYYLDSETSLRIRRSDNRRAQDLLERAVKLHEEARRALSDGDLALAEREIGLALRSISAASSALSRGNTPHAETAARNARLRDEIAGYRVSFDQGVLDKGPQFASLLDTQRADALLARADALTREGKHAEAEVPLREAYQLTVDAVTRLRSNETVVYALNFRTPADEYRYEEKRHESYALLVHQMVSTGAAQGSRQALVNRFLEDASRLASDARKQAEGGDHTTAIKTMEEANQSMVRALQSMGLAIPG